MGNCVASDNLSPEDEKARKEQKIRSKWIAEQMSGEAREDDELIKLLFLGAGESGKSTMLKQMRIRYCESKQTNDAFQVFKAPEVKHFIQLIHNNIIASSKVLVKQSAKLKIPLGDDIQEIKERVQTLSFQDRVTPALAADLEKLWKDQGTQSVFDQRAKYQLNDSTAYFYGRLGDVVKKNYVPTIQDILRARIRTTGIVEHSFQVENNDFRMYDVGGQRNARKKWIHCFDNVTSVIFVAALSAYNQVLYEDNRTNRMVEALQLFDDIINSEWFFNHPIILFLNKKDIFKEKIGSEPLKSCFPDYKGANDYLTAREHVRTVFLEHNKNKRRKIFAHFTNATDVKNFAKVFASVEKIILRLHLVDVGLLAAETDLGSEDDEYYDSSEAEDAPAGVQ